MLAPGQGLGQTRKARPFIHVDSCLQRMIGLQIYMPVTGLPGEPAHLIDQAITKALSLGRISQVQLLQLCIFRLTSKFRRAYAAKDVSILFSQDKV